MKCKKGDIVGSAIYDFLNNVKIEKVCGKKGYFFNRRLNKMAWLNRSEENTSELQSH